MDPFAVVHDVGALTLLGVWLGSAIWIYTDAQGRFERPDRAPKLLAAAITIPFAAPLLYACLRPPELVAERRARELARRVLEEELAPGERCLACRTPVEPEFLRCPTCADELRRRCPGCEATLRFHWSACPHCEHRLSEIDSGVRLVA
jgi:hypothetical protein